MNKEIEEWLVELAEITELEECILDVFENSMYKNKNPFYSLSLMTQIKDRSESLYEKIDKYSLTLNCDWSFMFFSYNWKYEV